MDKYTLTLLEIVKLPPRLVLWSCVLCILANNIWRACFPTSYKTAGCKTLRMLASWLGRSPWTGLCAHSATGSIHSSQRTLFVNASDGTSLPCLKPWWLPLSTSATPWTVARQASLPMGFPRREYWNRLLFPSLGDLPDLGIEPGVSCIAGRLYHLSFQPSPQPTPSPGRKVLHNLVSSFLFVSPPLAHFVLTVLAFSLFLQSLRSFLPQGLDICRSFCLELSPLLHTVAASLYLHTSFCLQRSLLRPVT